MTFNLSPFERLINTPQFEVTLLPPPKAAIGAKNKSNEKVGLEIELEKVQFHGPRDLIPYWQVTTDGSLKVNGREFITCVYTNKVKQAIVTLKENLRRYDANPRTSVHVHMNIADLNPLQVYLFALYYSIFEYPLVKFSGGRFSNFFCVPIHEWWDGGAGALTRWPKYSAINILPRLHRDNGQHLSTIEFRQMRGNLNEDYIQNWIDIILRLKTYIKEQSLEKYMTVLEEGNRTSSYNPLLKEIFKDKADLLYYPEINKDIEESIMRMKLKMFRLGVFKYELPRDKTGQVKWDKSDTILKLHMGAPHLNLLFDLKKKDKVFVDLPEEMPILTDLDDNDIHRHPFTWDADIPLTPALDRLIRTRINTTNNIEPPRPRNTTDRNRTDRIETITAVQWLIRTNDNGTVTLTTN